MDQDLTSFLFFAMLDNREMVTRWEKERERESKKEQHTHKQNRMLMAVWLLLKKISSSSFMNNKFSQLLSCYLVCLLFSLSSFLEFVCVCVFFLFLGEFYAVVVIRRRSHRWVHIFPASIRISVWMNCVARSNASNVRTILYRVLLPYHRATEEMNPFVGCLHLFQWMPVSTQ